MKYICECIKGSLFFDFNCIRCSCSNTGGIVFQPFDGKYIDFNNIKKIRDSIINNFSNGILPAKCKDCYMLKIDEEENIDKPYSKELDRIYISHWLHCNCGCIYCCNGNITGLKITPVKQKSEYYDLFPTIKRLCNEGYIGKNTQIHTIGGEPAVLEEFEDIMNYLSAFSTEKVTFLTSGIDFSETMYNFLQKGNADMYISLDCGSDYIFKKIKRVDAFCKVINNIKKYVSANPNDKHSVCLKYILIEGLNDSIEEINKFIAIAKSAGVKKILLDLNHNLNHCNQGKKVPEHWYNLFEYFKSIPDMDTFINDQCQQILDRKYVF